MWTDFYLKATDEAAFDAALPEQGFGPDVVLDVLGTLYHTSGVEGDPPTSLEGWHVNVRVWGEALPTALQPFEMSPPQYPKRVWA